MPTTSPDNIYFTDTSQPGNPITESATQATSIQAALNSRSVHSYKWNNSAARIAQTGMSEGDVGDQRDTNITYRYDGAQWRAISAGLIPAVPAGVAGSGVVLSAGGLVTFTGSTTVSVNGCFDSAFRRNQILIEWDSGAASDVFLRFRSGGTDATGLDYTTQGVHNAAAAVTGVGALNSYIPLSYADLEVGSSRVELRKVSAATITRYQTQGESSNAAGTSVSAMFSGGNHKVAAAYDGFTIYRESGGTLSGELVVYGFNSNI